MAVVDLSGAEIVDAHTHPYRLADLLERGSTGFDTRLTFLGESFHSSSSLDPALWPTADALTGSTVLGIAVVRWLARHLGCEPTREAVTAARDAALREDSVGYTRGLLDAAGVVAVLSDEGYPQPPIPAQEFSRTIGVAVHRVARLEPWIVDRRGGTFDELVDGVRADAVAAGADPTAWPSSRSSPTAPASTSAIRAPRTRRRRSRVGATTGGGSRASTRSRSATS